MRNKYLLILFLLTGILGFSQQYNYVQVDNTYTPDRLVNDVFVKSSCDLVSNVRYQNGDGSPQTLQYYTLGYFEKNGSTFPFDDGIVLCTNESQYIPGPFTGSSFDFHGSNNFRWGGDKDLNDAITAGGGAHWLNIDLLNYSLILYPFKKQLVLNIYSQAIVTIIVVLTFVRMGQCLSVVN